MIPADEVRALVTEAVQHALSEHDGKPTLLDRTALARALSCSASHVDNMRRAGLPTVFLGEAPRFLLSDVLAWIKTQRSPE